MLSDPRLRRLKETILAGVEWFWIIGFTLAGRWHRRRGVCSVNHWTASTSPRHILVVAPHPDDEAIGCAGAIIKHKQEGDAVWIAYITDGRQSRALGLAALEMAQRRRQEAQAAAGILGVDGLEWFGLAEGAWSAAELKPRLQTLLERFQPDIIYAPSRIDFHPEHHQIAYLLAQLLPERPTPLVRIYQIHLPLTPVLTNVVVDTSRMLVLTRAALEAHASQFYSVAKTRRMRRYAAHFYGLSQQAEEFWELPAARYRQLHQSPPGQWSGQAFWGIRFHPFSDPLAYLKGLAERRRLAKLVN